MIRRGITDVDRPDNVRLKIGISKILIEIEGFQFINADPRNAPYPERPFLNSDGVIPVWILKARLKEALLLNPASRAN